MLLYTRTCLITVMINDTFLHFVIKILVSDELNAKSPEHVLSHFSGDHFLNSIIFFGQSNFYDRITVIISGVRIVVFFQ